MISQSHLHNEKPHGTQQPECAWAHEDSEHRATPYLGGAVGCAKFSTHEPPEFVAGPRRVGTLLCPRGRL